MLRFPKYLNNKGLTLIEVIVSIVILGIILLFFMNYLSQSMFSSSKVEQNLTAVNIADRILYEFDSNVYYQNINSTCPNTVPGNLDFLPQDSSSKRYYELNNQKYYPIISLCQSSSEKSLNLYRVNIKIYDKNNMLLTDIFDYLY